MTNVRVIAGTYTFRGHFEEEAALRTVAAFRKHLPFTSKIIHVRWSGEGVWVPLGDMSFGVGFENNTCHPAPGHVILYPGGVSETELLLAYGPVSFASKAGPLSGNHFLTLTEGLENLHTLGRKTLLEGQQDIHFELA
jgi:hypothetical protein